MISYGLVLLYTLPITNEIIIQPSETVAVNHIGELQPAFLVSNIYIIYQHVLHKG